MNPNIVIPCFCLMQKAFGFIASAARTANRVVAVTKGEAENSTDTEFKTNLDSSSSAVTAGVKLYSSGGYGVKEEEEEGL